jgi:membrane protein
VSVAQCTVGHRMVRPYVSQRPPRLDRGLRHSGCTNDRVAGFGSCMIRSPALLRRAWAVPRDVWRHAGSSDVNGLAAELAFRSFLAFIPFFVVVVTSGNWLTAGVQGQNLINRAFELLSESLAPDVAAAISSELNQVVATRPGGVFGGALLAMVLLGMSAGAAVLKGVNRAYNLQEHRSWWTRWLLGLGIALLAECILGAGLTLLGAAQIFGYFASTRETPATFWLLAAAARWPLALLVLLLQASFVYRLAPSETIPWRSVLPGAMVFAAGWLVASALFNAYVDMIGVYAPVFGFLGGVVVLLVWFQITAYSLLLGAELNAALARAARSTGLSPCARQASADGAQKA